MLLSLLVIVAGGIVALFLLRESAPVPATAATSLGSATQVSLPIADAAPLVDSSTDLPDPATAPEPLPATASLEDSSAASFRPSPRSQQAITWNRLLHQARQVLTNAHVIQGQTTVTLQVGEAIYSARGFKRVSTGSDLACFRCTALTRSSRAHAWGRCPQLRVGEEVIAVGSALGVLSNTVTAASSAPCASRARHAHPDRRGDQSGQQRRTARQSLGTGDRHQLARGCGAGRRALAFAVAIDHATDLLDGQRVTAPRRRSRR